MPAMPAMAGHHDVPSAGTTLGLCRLQALRAGSAQCSTRCAWCCADTALSCFEVQLRLLGRDELSQHGSLMGWSITKVAWTRAQVIGGLAAADVAERARHGAVGTTRAIRCRAEPI